MSSEPGPRPTAGAAFLTNEDDAIGFGPARVSKGRLRRARGRAQADLDSAGSLLRGSLARVRGQAGAKAAAPAVPQRDRRPDGSLVSPPLPPPMRRVPTPGRNGAESPIAAIKERWRDAVREGKLAAKEREAEIRAEYERRVRHDPRLHAQHHGVLPPPRPDQPEATSRRQ